MPRIEAIFIVTSSTESQNGEGTHNLRNYRHVNEGIGAIHLQREVVAVSSFRHDLWV